MTWFIHMVMAIGSIKFATDELVSDFINGGYDFSILRDSSRVYDAKYGFCQFFSTEKYIEGGLENENFESLWV